MSSNFSSDPLSDFLRRTRAEVAVAGSFHAGGQWALHFPAPAGLKFCAVTRGAAWLQIDGQKEVHRLVAGNVVLLNTRASYLVAHDPALPPVEAEELIASIPASDPVFSYQGGEDYRHIGGHISLDPERAAPLAELIPECAVIKGDTEASETMQCYINELVRESTNRAPGYQFQTSRLAQMLFVQALRLFLDQNGSAMKGSWLRVMSDTRLLPALRCMHAEPGRSWSLEELASAAAMSRTGFAVRFREKAGTPPLNYLTQWRMLLAQDYLRASDKPIGAWVEEIGYSSESAFSQAFKRQVGISPAQYRNQYRSD